jgi:hypothetical protein
MYNPGSYDELPDECWTKPHVSAKAKHAGNPISVGIHPRLRNIQKPCDNLRYKQWIEAAKPQLYILTAEAESEEPGAMTTTC